MSISARTLGATLAAVFLMSAAGSVRADSSMTYRIPPRNDPGLPIEVYLDVTSDRSDVASVGARMTFNDSEVSLQSVELGSDAPASWGFIFRDTSVSGRVDVVVTDQTTQAATIDTPSSSEILKLTFTRDTASCAPTVFSFNASDPAPGPPASAFPLNQYVIWVGSDVVLEVATPTGRAGPVTQDHRFLRGNVNNRSAGVLDIQDVIDLAASLFTAFSLSFDCAAASDINNDGNLDIVDVIALVQGVFGASGFDIPPPSGSPGLGTPDGGTIPSVLGCAEGEGCA